MDWLVDPFQAEFVRTGALAAAAVGVICGVVGCYVILRGMALMSDSLAHGVLPGVAIAFALTAGSAGEDPDQAAIWLGALAAGLFTAAATSFVLRRSRVREETAAAVVFVFMLALGVAIVSGVEGYSVDLTSFLFGDVLGVSGGEATPERSSSRSRSSRSSPFSTGPSCCSRSTRSGPPRSACRSSG